MILLEDGRYKWPKHAAKDKWKHGVQSGFFAINNKNKC
jgi:hypothetical protein